MLVIRPVRKTDLEGLHDLTAHTGFGLTTLPRDRDLLAERIVEMRRVLPAWPTARAANATCL